MAGRVGAAPSMYLARSHSLDGAILSVLNHTLQGTKDVPRQLGVLVGAVVAPALNAGDRACVYQLHDPSTHASTPQGLLQPRWPPRYYQCKPPAARASRQPLTLRMVAAVTNTSPLGIRTD